MSIPPDWPTQQPLVSNGCITLTGDRTIITLLHLPFLCSYLWVGFSALQLLYWETKQTGKAAIICAEATGRKSLLSPGICSQDSQAPSLKGYHHPGRSHPPSRTLPGEGGSVPACPVPNNLSFPPQSNTIFLAAKKQPVINCQYTTGGTTCQKQSWMLTLRTDTRQMQGSRSPVAGLALILHTKVNFFFQRTQFSWTSSLWERKKKNSNTGTKPNQDQLISEDPLQHLGSPETAPHKGVKLASSFSLVNTGKIHPGYRNTNHLINRICL